jgi:hypothetical protein
MLPQIMGSPLSQGRRATRLQMNAEAAEQRVVSKLVDRLGTTIVEPARAPRGGFLVCCNLLYSRGHGEVDCLCIPAGGGLRAQVLYECYDPLGEHFGRAKVGSLVCFHQLIFRARQGGVAGQEVDVAEYVRFCRTYQRTAAEHCGPRTLPLPSRLGGMIGVDCVGC